LWWNLFLTIHYPIKQFKKKKKQNKKQKKITKKSISVSIHSRMSGNVKHLKLEVLPINQRRIHSMRQFHWFLKCSSSKPSLCVLFCFVFHSIMNEWTTINTHTTIPHPTWCEAWLK
jgi:hypothetical protein